MRIIIDAMGGDNAPDEIVHGAIEAAQTYGVDLTLVGRGDEILEAMRESGIDTLPAGVEILNADDEGVEVKGEGLVGLITYMRTDSLRLSDDALYAAKDFILGRYGKEYYNGAPRRFKSQRQAQDAHEAIRPSNVRLDPESIRSDLTPEQYKL